eukprot:6458631-Prymnesium_polylepis.4
MHSCSQRNGAAALSIRVCLRVINSSATIEREPCASVRLYMPSVCRFNWQVHLTLPAHGPAIGFGQIWPAPPVGKLVVDA